MPTLGVCYYPEHWHPSTWVEQAKQMKNLGLSWVRIGEFSWSRLEPKCGDYQFAWLDQAIDILTAANLRIVLGTPTATPPRWMIDLMPDMLACDEQGNARKFGSRRHYCFSHEGYRQQCVRIATLLAQRYDCKVHGWQIDNEYGCHNTTHSYSESSLHRFRDWLQKKYTSIDTLNQVWGNVFWSMEYNHFTDIELPNNTVTVANPSHLLDFFRFSSDQVIAFHNLQADAIRQHSTAPIIHNFMAKETSFDHFTLARKLDIVAWDSYPTGFLETCIRADNSYKERFMRQGDPDFQAFHHDLYRAVGKGNLWIMEQQPGPVNWAPHNPAPLDGMVRLWSWEAFAHGAQNVSFFRWRQSPFAQEQMHSGLLQSDGRPAIAFPQVQQLAKEIGDITLKQLPAKIAIVFDYESMWAWKALPHGENFAYFDMLFDYYRAWKKLGIAVDILPVSSSAIQDYAIVCIPGLLIPAEAQLRALNSFTGILVAGPRSFAKDRNLQTPVEKLPALTHFDYRLEYVESVAEGIEKPLANGGSFIRWFEQMAALPQAKCRVLECAEDGSPAIIGNKKIRYLCGWGNQQALTRIFADLADEIAIPTVPLPEGLRIRDTQDYRFFFNYSNTPTEVDGRTIPAAGVAWQKHAK